MPATLDHTIVPATDKAASAAFLAHVLGIEGARAWGPFVVVPVGNGTTLDFVDAPSSPEHHYAFLVDEHEFDEMFARVRASGAAYYADPFRRQPGEVNHHYGGRGVYFDDPDGHLMEILTQPYDVPGL